MDPAGCGQENRLDFMLLCTELARRLVEFCSFPLPLTLASAVSEHWINISGFPAKDSLSPCHADLLLGRSSQSNPYQCSRWIKDKARCNHRLLNLKCIALVSKDILNCLTTLTVKYFFLISNLKLPSFTVYCMYNSEQHRHTALFIDVVFIWAVIAGRVEKWGRRAHVLVCRKQFQLVILLQRHRMPVVLVFIVLAGGETQVRKLGLALCHLSPTGEKN